MLKSLIGSEWPPLILTPDPLLLAPETKVTMLPLLCIPLPIPLFPLLFPLKLVPRLVTVLPLDMLLFDIDLAEVETKDGVTARTVAEDPSETILAAEEIVLVGQFVLEFIL